MTPDAPASPGYDYLAEAKGGLAAGAKPDAVIACALIDIAQSLCDATDLLAKIHKELNSMTTYGLPVEKRQY